MENADHEEPAGPGRFKAGAVVEASLDWIYTHPHKQMQPNFQICFDGIGEWTVF